ncbi:uncharacterized protein [Mobula birostris]|uniref:uncharacterized protein n=1 Tax=Mobula birostris TaxID=1983395 RepID=UPI003B27EEE3
MEEHITRVRDILMRLPDHGLYVKREKCEFHTAITSSLGSIISNGNLKMDPTKPQAVRDRPQPSSVKQVQQFLGFANFYQKFIGNFSSVAAPLTALTKKSKGSFVWMTKVEAALAELKEWFTSASTLVTPDPDLPFIMEVDTSHIGVAAVLSQ